MSLCTTRLRKEFKELQKNPVENIRAAPKETNILEWHYVLLGEKDSIYNGGYYHGTVVFPPDYPYKPPTIRMITPNGRFKTNARLCLSMSDFHPESWNPMWKVSTILMGLYSFMLDDSPTNGSMESTDAEKRAFAAASLEFNTHDKLYCELFPELVALHLENKKISEESVPEDTTIMENAPVALSSSETCCSRKSDATTCSNSTTPVNIEFTEKESGFSTPVFASSSLPKPPALSAAQGLKDPTAASDEDVSSQLQVERLSVVPPVVPK